MRISDRLNFYIKLVLFIFIFALIVYSFLLAVYDPAPKFAGLTKSDRISVFFSYFTIQSNVILCIYFFIFLFNAKFNKHRIHFIIMLATTTYIIITMLVFWIGIFTNVKSELQYDKYNWIATIFLHAIFPIVMILTFIFTAGYKYYDFRYHHLKPMWAIMAYPFLYLISITIRGYFRTLSYPGKPGNFPYFFFNWYENGVELYLIAVVMVCIAGIIIQYLLIFINNCLYLKYNFQHQPKIKKLFKSQYDLAKSRAISKPVKAGLIMAIVISCLNIALFIVILILHNVDVQILNIFYFNSGLLYNNVLASFVFAFAIIIIVSSCFALKKNQIAQYISGVFVIIFSIVIFVTIIAPIISLIAGLLILDSKYTNKDKNNQILYTGYY